MDVGIIYSVIGMLVLSIGLCGCLDAKPSELGDSSVSSQKENDKGKQMQAIFGPDYKRGDIGHSIGHVQSVDKTKSFITINHGVIHGTHMGSMEQTLEHLEKVERVDFRAGEEVKFLVRKGRDDTYRIFMICSMDKEGPECLKSQMNGPKGK